jgi:hypothetical protein
MAMDDVPVGLRRWFELPRMSWGYTVILPLISAPLLLLPVLIESPAYESFTGSTWSAIGLAVAVIALIAGLLGVALDALHAGWRVLRFIATLTGALILASVIVVAKSDYISGYSLLSATGTVLTCQALCLTIWTVLLIHRAWVSTRQRWRIYNRLLQGDREWDEMPRPWYAPQPPAAGEGA